MPSLAKSLADDTPDSTAPSAPDPAAAWVRVRDRTNNREYDIAPVTFRPDAHELLNEAQWPDVHGFGAAPRPAVYPAETTTPAPDATPVASSDSTR
jgi:hypothetical protein